jgi:hypothetical protein
MGGDNNFDSTSDSSAGPYRPVSLSTSIATTHISIGADFSILFNLLKKKKVIIRNLL